jgi:hypothetical protein
MSNNASNGKCFVIMPFSDPTEYEKGHFDFVYNGILCPAIESANFSPVRADDNKSGNIIHKKIMDDLINSSMVLCDLSTRNPNVLFELGIRQVVDKPFVLVQEKDTPRIFDVAFNFTPEYEYTKDYVKVIKYQNDIKKALIDTYNEWKNGKFISIIKLFSPEVLAKNNIFNNDPYEQCLRYINSEDFINPKKIEDAVKIQHEYHLNVDRMEATGVVDNSKATEIEYLRERFYILHKLSQNNQYENLFEDYDSLHYRIQNILDLNQPSK